MTIQNRRLTIIIFSVASLLLIPFLAMQFTDQVQWSSFDFLIMGFLLLSVGLSSELMLRRVKKVGHRLIIGAAILIIFLLVWAELAVGIFGTPFAGS